MYQRIAFCLLFLVGFTVNAQTTINLHGTVSNQAGKPIAKAVVTLLRQGLMDTTGDNGAYSITKGNVAVLPSLAPQTEEISLNRGVLELSLSNSSPVRVEIFNAKGDLLKKEFLQNALAGVYRWNIAENSRVANLLVIHASIGRHAITFRYLPMHNGNYAVHSRVESFTSIGGRLAKIAAAIDSLKTTADGYTTKVVTISSYDTEINITLDTAGGATSQGCGKTNHPASGKTTISVSGASRQYMLKLPTNYTPNTPYKLIFCWHWRDGSYDDVINNGYYGLEKLANNTAIFVAPNGINKGWDNSNGRDINFLKAMLGYFDSTLCFDKKRIFSVGWSYGGMMSLSIGCSMANVFRAIAPMSGAFYSGCDDKANKDPIAMWQSHGNNDGTVPLSNGKTALQYFLERNGCGTQTTPVDPSPCVQYQGCKEGYPVIFCEFSGGHEQPSFASDAIWKFFSKF